MKTYRKPCPVCGYKKIWIVRIMTRSIFMKKWYCECSYCHFCWKQAYTKRGAIRMWNRSTNIVSIKNTAS